MQVYISVGMVASAAGVYLSYMVRGAAAAEQGAAQYHALTTDTETSEDALPADDTHTPDNDPEVADE